MASRITRWNGTAWVSVADFDAVNSEIAAVNANPNLYDSGWIHVHFENGWRNYDAPGLVTSRPVQYRKLGHDMYFRGIMGGGTVAAVPAFHVPAAWADTVANNHHPITSGYAFAVALTNYNAEVCCYVGNNAWVDMSNIRYSTLPLRQPTAMPTDIPGMVVHLDASDASTFTYSSGAVVQEWRDKISARVFTNATVGERPSRSGSRNGLATVVFDGADYLHFTGTCPLDNANVTVLVVFAETAYSNPGGDNFKGIFGVAAAAGTDHNSGTGWAVNTGAGASRFYAERNSIGSSLVGGGDPTPWNVGAAKFTSSGQVLAVHDHVVGTVPTPSAATWAAPGKMLLGTRWVTGASTLPLNGEIGEVCVFNRILTDLEYHRWYSYLKNKWNT